MKGKVLEEVLMNNATKMVKRILRDNIKVFKDIKKACQNQKIGYNRFVT